jgi:hypothetical protein
MSVSFVVKVTNGGLVSLLVVLESTAAIMLISDVEVLNVVVTKSKHLVFYL